MMEDIRAETPGAGGGGSLCRNWMLVLGLDVVYDGSSRPREDRTYSVQGDKI